MHLSMKAVAEPRPAQDVTGVRRCRRAAGIGQDTPGPLDAGRSRFGIALAALLLVAGTGLVVARGQAAEMPGGLDPATARCVLQHIEDVRGKEAVDLLVRACRSLIEQGDGGGADETGAPFLVRCVVPGDPAWIDHRLVTREQCAQAQGITGSR